MTNDWSYDRVTIMSRFRPTEERQDAFLEALSVTGIIKDACDAAGIHRNTVAYWLENDPTFEPKFNDAKEESNDLIRRQIHNRAFGYRKELHYKGLKTGDTIEEYSESLLTLLARSRMPKEFRQNTGIELSESPELSEVRERFLDRLSAMAERMQADEPTAIEPGSTE